jgi:hypothetical protein
MISDGRSHTAARCFAIVAVSSHPEAAAEVVGQVLIGPTTRASSRRLADSGHMPRPNRCQRHVSAAQSQSHDLIEDLHCKFVVKLLQVAVGPKLLKLCTYITGPVPEAPGPAPRWGAIP